MRIGDIMSEDVETISQQASVAEARDLMRRQETRHLVVMDGRRVAGVLSARDLGRPGAIKGDTGIEAVLSGPVITASRNTTVQRAANLLRGHRVGCLPIVEDGRPVGILTVSNVLELLGEGATRAKPKPAASHREEKHRGRPRARTVPRH
jgi:acetoin utilization protein AcuB